MCVSYGISLCLYEIRIYLYDLFTFAKLPDNSNGVFLILLCKFRCTYRFKIEIYIIKVTHRAASFQTSVHTGELLATIKKSSVHTGKLVHWICNFCILVKYFRTSTDPLYALVKMSHWISNFLILVNFFWTSGNPLSTLVNLRTGFVTLSYWLNIFNQCGSIVHTGK